AVVLAGGSNVLVHLKPAPVVARVMTSTNVLHDDLESWLTREVTVGVFLAERAVAVAPTRLAPPGPHQHDGLWMTLWDYVPHDTSGGLPGANELGDSLRRLHAALAEFTGELEQLMSIQQWIGRLLDELRPAPSLSSADIESLRARLHGLTPRVFDSPQPTQAIHGDTSISNLLRTDHGLLWNDLEDVCSGPVAWDVAGLVTSARIRGADDAFVEEMLDAYGGPRLDELSDFIAADELYMTVWQSYDVQRRRGNP
ncbi:MAG TPA: aminoglycoside phosphotransferase family protein, partial [Thermoleophilaceae bacterium]